MRAIFLCPPSRAFGEINTLMPLARGITAGGGDTWFLASPNAAAVARTEFPAQTFEMNGSREHNQIVLLRMLRKFRPDLLVFAEFYEIARPRRRPDCPLVDRYLLEVLDAFEGSLVFVDFIAHVARLREIAECAVCARRFGGDTLRRFLSRLFVVLPCPLNDPGPVEGRRGIPFRSLELPRRIGRSDRARIRARYLAWTAAEAEGKTERDAHGFLVLRTGSTWQTKLAEKYGVGLYRHLGGLLGYYLADLPKPVTLVSVSSAHRIELSGQVPGLRLHNIANLPPPEFERLVLAADLVLTDNEIAYTLCTTIGRVPGVVLINSHHGADLIHTLEEEPVRQVVLALERDQPGSVYPYKVFPIPAGRREFAGQEERKAWPCVMRLGRMRSSPFTQAEIYGGERTRQQLRQLLCDAHQRSVLRREEAAYIARLNTLEDGVGVLARIAQHRVLMRHCAL